MSLCRILFKNKVLYKRFHKWYKDTRHYIIPVEVEGQVEQDTGKFLSISGSSGKTAFSSRLVKIMVDIRLSNSMHIQQQDFKLRRFEKLGWEIGVVMLNITRFYYLRNLYDKRCRYDRVHSVIH